MKSTLKLVTLKNLLTMTAPYTYKFSTPCKKYFTSNDYVNFTLDLLGGKGLGKFRYTPLIGPDILSGILVKATGQSVFDFATEKLFSPLGIPVKSNVYFHDKDEQIAFNKAKHISGWVVDQTGVHTAGWGLTPSPADKDTYGGSSMRKKRPMRLWEMAVM